VADVAFCSNFSEDKIFLVVEGDAELGDHFAENFVLFFDNVRLLLSLATGDPVLIFLDFLPQLRMFVKDPGVPSFPKLSNSDCPSVHLGGFLPGLTSDFNAKMLGVQRSTELKLRLPGERTAV
jgi:hypothetical protein